MPQRKCAVKRLRADKKRRLLNIKAKNELKKTLKNFQNVLTANNAEEAKKMLHQVASKLDKAAQKGILSKNTSRRKKSRLMLKLKRLDG